MLSTSPLKRYLNGGGWHVPSKQTINDYPVFLFIYRVNRGVEKKTASCLGKEAISFNQLQIKIISKFSILLGLRKSSAEFLNFFMSLVLASYRLISHKKGTIPHYYNLCALNLLKHENIESWDKVMMVWKVHIASVKIVNVD